MMVRIHGTILFYFTFLASSPHDRLLTRRRSLGLFVLFLLSCSFFSSFLFFSLPFCFSLSSHYYLPGFQSWQTSRTRDSSIQGFYQNPGRHRLDWRATGAGSLEGLLKGLPA